MPAAVRVRPISPIWSLDREFDYLLNDGEIAEFGQRVLVPIGKQKTPEMALVVETLDRSEFANRPIERILQEPPSITREHLAFLDSVAKRYCVSLGEVLGLAIPDYMTRAAQKTPDLGEEISAVERVLGDGRSVAGGLKAVVLTQARSNLESGLLLPDWTLQAIRESKRVTAAGKSVLICVPEHSDIELLKSGFEMLAAEVEIVAQGQSETKTQRYLRYRSVQQGTPKVVLVTRSGILWNVANLGLIIVHDELDDSLRDPGSPFLVAWEVALLRANESVSVIFLSAYRSAQLQRLVRMGYLASTGKDQPLRNIEVSKPEEIEQKSVIPFLKRTLANGTVLVVTTRKGSNVSVGCKECGKARVCASCSGSFWVNPDQLLVCKVCHSPMFGKCLSCGSDEVRLGKIGMTRIAADLGKALPGVRVIQVDADSSKSIEGKPNQLVVATSGTAPYLADGYSGLLIFDASAWLADPHPTASLIAYRDWLAAIELLRPAAPVYIRNTNQEIAQQFALGNFISAADESVTIAIENRLFPETKYFRIEVDGNPSPELTARITENGGELLKVIDDERSTLIGRIPATKSTSFAIGIRPWVKTQKPSKTNPKRRPITVEFDYEVWK